MEILGKKPESKPGAHIVLMFGVGMLGSAIRNSLINSDYKLVARVDFDWEHSENRAKKFILIETLCLAYSQTPERLSIVWSAGKGRFHATQAEVARENDSFLDTTRFAQMLKKKLGCLNFVFHYISSAGGLFEGQRVINNASVPEPIRPYGRLKLAQEQILQESFTKDQYAIYRPSSVYGPMVQKTQQGLISNLVHNGRNGQVTVLDARIMTLRDYVFSGDIGNFIARHISSKTAGLNSSQIYFLVSARCSSIFEIVLRIERILYLNLNVRYDESYGNNSNITFSADVLPTGWSPSSLDVGLRQFLLT